MKKHDTAYSIHITTYQIKKLYCKKCDFYVEGECTKKRIATKCLRDNLRNKE